MKSSKKGTSSSNKRTKRAKFMRVPLVLAAFAVTVSAAVLGGLLPAGTFSTSAQGLNATEIGKQSRGIEDPNAWIQESARQQIADLIEEKRNRTPAQKKMDSSLIYSIRMSRGQELARGLATMDITLPRNEEGTPVIDITARVTEKFLSKLEKLGVNVISSFPRYNTVRVEASLEVLETIAAFSEVIHLQPKQEPLTNQHNESSDFDPDHLSTVRPGFDIRENFIREKLLNSLGGDVSELYSINIAGVRKSEADVTMRALFSRNNYGFDGTGVKIGVLSDGVRNLAAVQASGDVGPVTVLPGQSGTSAGQCNPAGQCDEGTAMLELIHDVAPGAQLYFATAYGTPAAFAQNIRDLRAAGCDIIIDDIFYFAESPFQDGQALSVVSPTNGGIVAQAVADVTASGALYFSSAGNSGNKNDNTSGVWEGDWVDGGAAPAPIGAANGNLHQFPLDGATPAQNFNTVVTVGSSQYNLNWSDPLGGSSNDYDLYALNAAGTTVVTSSANVQDGNDDPFEAIAVTAAGTRLVIAKFSGAGRYLRLTTNRGRLTVNTPGQTTGHSTVAAAFGVAATPAIGPFPSPHSAANVLETFSSDGPRKLFYQADGTAFTPGNVSSTGGIVRQKPDIAATDGTSVTGAGGFGIQFFGTSAAAPHAGAVAALLKSGNPALTPAQIRTALQSTAIDIEGAGVDRDSGSGIVMADAAFGTFFAPPSAANITAGTPTVADIGGNNNGYIEPGEAATISIPLQNTGVIAATAVSATLSSTTPGVSFTPSATRAYPDIPATSGTSNSATPFGFVYLGTATYAADIDFVLTVTYNSGITRSYDLKVPTGQLAIISSTLDATAPAGGANYTAATGTQTGRKNFTFPISSCGTPKAAPTNVATGARRYDAYTFTNTSGSTICASVLLTHSSNVLLHANAYLNGFTPATPGTNWAADSGGSSTSGAGTAQLFTVSVPAGQTLVVVVSESNAGGAPNTPYTLRVGGLPPLAVPANQAPVHTTPAGTQNVSGNSIYTFAGASQIAVADPDASNNLLRVAITVTNGTFTLSQTTGLNFTVGDGAQDASMTFTGTLANINAALTNSYYRVAVLNYSGSASVNIATDDLGNVGAGNNLTDSDTVNLNVLAPTAATVNIGGRVSDSGGRGLPMTIVMLTGQDGQTRTTITNGFGYYDFGDIPAGGSYAVSVSAKRYTFSNPVKLVNANNTISDLDFIADN